MRGVLCGITLAFLLCLPYGGIAKHIVGGEMTYTCLKYNPETGRATFRISFYIYRDAYPERAAPFDAEAIIGVFRGTDTKGYQYVTSFTTDLLLDEKIDISTGIPCLKPPENIDIYKGYYEFDITIETSDTDNFMIAYQRCCRNSTILNILDAATTGAAYTTVITPEAQRLCDNSPVFKDQPPSVICQGEEVDFDHSATDVDGDSLVYSFCRPLQAGGVRGSRPYDLDGDAQRCDGVMPSPVNCRPPFRSVDFRSPAYTYEEPMKGDPVIRIDSETGLITGVPNVLGQFVVGVCVESYRDGKLIGRILRDFQFNVAVCEPNLKASIKTDSTDFDGNQFVLNCGELTIDFINTSIDPKDIKTYHWEFYLSPQDTFKSMQKDVRVTFPDTGKYKAKLYLNKDLRLKRCRDTLDIDISMYPSLLANFTYEHDTCKIEPVKFKNISEHKTVLKSFSWSSDGELIGKTKDFQQQFSKPGQKRIVLAIEDEHGCKSTHEELVSYYPVPEVLYFDPSRSTGCSPERIQLDLQNDIVDSSYTVVWKLSNGDTVTGLNPWYTFEEHGIFSLDVSVTSPNGCMVRSDFKDRIAIKEGTKAAFSYTPDRPTILNNLLEFTNESERSVRYVWTIDEEFLSREKDVRQVFPDTGVFQVKLISFHENNCTDTALAVVDILPINTLYMPNAFTPDDDGLNDGFKGKGYFGGIKEFEMLIYNRWGDNVFGTKDTEEAWNGRVQNDGAECPQGVYVYKVYFIDARNKPQTIKGKILLLRE